MSSTSRLKSQIWLHFTDRDAENKVKCLYCGQQLSIANKSTCSLIRHLNKKHPTQDIIVRQAHTDSNNVNSKKYKQRRSKMPKIIYIDTQLPSTADSNPSPETPPPSNSNVPKYKKIDGFFCNNTTMNTRKQKDVINTKKQKEIDRQLLSMIVKEYHPFSIVEDKEFVHFINLLNPAYKLPTRKTVSHSLIPVMYNETVEKVKNRLDRAFAVCLTTDGWMSKTQESFYAITAHYIVENNDGMALDSDLLGCISVTDSLNPANIAMKLKDLITEWQIDDKVMVIVSDSADNMKGAVRSGEWRHWDCFAHSLNRITQTGMKEIQAVIDKIKTIVSYFKRSSFATAQLAATQENMELPPLKLKNDDHTRWNSTFDMINRIFTIKNAVVSTITVLKSPLVGENEEIEEVDDLTNDEWMIIEQAVQVLEVFDTLTTVISSVNKVTVSSIIIYVKQLRTHLHRFQNNRSNLMPEINNMVEQLLTELNSQFFSERNHIEDNDLIGLSTILDPRYKKFGFIDEAKYKKMLEKLYSQVANITIIETFENTSPNYEVEYNESMSSCTSMGDKLDNILFKDFDNLVQGHLRPVNARASAVDEVNKYLEEPILQRKDANGVNTDPLLWWFQRKHVYPRLIQLVKTSLCIMATSVPCERIFSRAGQIVNERRANLKASKVSEMVFLNYNLNAS